MDIADAVESEDLDSGFCQEGTANCTCFPNQTCFPGLKCHGGICLIVTGDPGPGDPGFDLPDVSEPMDAGDIQDPPDGTDLPVDAPEIPMDTPDPGPTDLGLDEKCQAACEFHCGAYQGCTCGGCLPGFECEAHICVPDCSAVEDEPDDNFIDANCDGIDGTVASSVFVAPLQHGGDDFNPGTMDLPKETIQAAIDAAAEAPDKNAVLVSAGTYPGALTLPDGVSLHGGYHKPVGWQRSTDYVVTVVVDESNANGDRIGIHAEGIQSWPPNPTIDRLVLEMTDNPSPGGSSYGLYLRDADKLEVRNLVIKMGKAGNGQNGAGLGHGATGQGTNGTNGGSGCEHDNNDDDCGFCSQPYVGKKGTAPASCKYGEKPGDGGAGGEPGLGDYYYDALSKGDDGDPGNGINNAPTLGGKGGAGADYYGEDGKFGENGADGAPGTDGSGGPGFGTFKDFFYHPASGGTDVAPTNGKPGTGAGGGGGGGGGERYYDEFLHKYYCDTFGGSGGGGGAGSCPGERGASGKGGGAVFGILFVDTYPKVHDVSVINATGGKGGSGQNGGSGKPGGGGGWGGSEKYSNHIPSGAGEHGGQGGDGGRGGHGGGGGGGPSFCFYFYSPTTTTDTSKLQDFTCEGTVGGDGGGSSGNPGVTGLTGEVDACDAACSD